MNECCASTAAPQDLAQLFAFGALLSLGHCLAMCGPLISTVLCAERSAVGARPFAATLARYHAGRIASYALLGAGIGALGAALPGGPSTVTWQAVLAFLAAATLAWIGLGQLGWLPAVHVPFAARLSRTIARACGRGVLARRAPREFGMGVANGFLPCGPVYTVAVAALVAGSAARGAFALAAFGLGTVPVLVAFSFGWRWTGTRLRGGLKRAGALVALTMALQLGLRASAALEWLPHARFAEVVLW